eukprot:4140587-Alexandrium_andersonii.AAC.1
MLIRPLGRRLGCSRRRYIIVCHAASLDGLAQREAEVGPRMVVPQGGAEEKALPSSQAQYGPT